MKDKLIDGFYKVKSYWGKPPTGYDVPYKEVACFTVGFGSLGIMSVIVQWTALAANMPLMVNHFKASTGIIFILGMLASVIGLVRAPILSMIIDNANSKKGKFKPFIMWTALVSCIAFALIPFIPSGWVDIQLFSFTMPKMSLFGIHEASKVSMNLGLLLMFILVQVGTTIHTLFTQCMTGVENTISTVAQERSGIVAIKNLISNLPNSVVNIIMPLVAVALFPGMGMDNVGIYRIFFPIVAIIAMGFAVVMVRGTNERIVIAKAHKNKTGFWKGAAALSKNKYFWLLVIFTVFSGMRGGANIYMWICNYAIPNKDVGTALIAVCNMVLNNAFIPGLLLAPMLIKKFGKSKVMTASNIGFAVMTALQLVMIFNPYVTLVGIFFQNLCLSVSFVSSLMTSDALDYQQYKTNQRLEGFWHNYSAFILTIAGLATGILSPLFLAMGGINFGDSINVAMQDPILRMNAFRNTTYLALIGGVLCIIPMLFYDLSEYKHRNIIRALKIRKAAENHADGTVEDNDILAIKEVLAYLEDLKGYEERTDIPKKTLKEYRSSKYLLDEFVKYDPTIFEEMLLGYDEAKVRNDYKVEQQRLDNLKRNIELEEKIMALRLVGAEKKAAKKGIDYDAEVYKAELIAKSRFMKDKYQLADLKTVGDSDLQDAVAGGEELELTNDDAANIVDENNAVVSDVDVASVPESDAVDVAEDEEIK